MLVYEKVVEGIRHLFGTMGNIPSEDDEQLTYKDNDGDIIEPTLNASYFDDKKGGIVDAEGKEVNVFIGDTCIIGDVEESEVVKLTVKTAPTKTSYIEGEALDLAGLVLEAEMLDGDKKEITSGFTSQPEDGATLATTDTKVTITYGGKTAEQAITVSEKQLESIAMTKTTTTYVVGDALDTSDATVTATYNNGETADVTSEAVFTPANGTVLAVTDTELVATFGGKTASVALTVTEPVTENPEEQKEPKEEAGE